VAINIKNLPNEFLNKMKNIMGEGEFKEFVLSFNMQRQHGLRINTLKIDVEHFLKISPFKLEKIPWSEDGFYYNEDDNPTKHPYYFAGLYYIQEPSAMLPAELLNAKPGEFVLDLCAAPGGKTTKIAAGMEGEGLLVANDINCDRIKALIKNVELYGLKNTVVSNETPEKLVCIFPEYFDKILIDAPCSGEGMFRKDNIAIRSWEYGMKVKNYPHIQLELLEHSDKMLKQGGRIVYSTCTFSPEENEQVIAKFLERHENYELLQIKLPRGADPGRPEWANKDERMLKTIRIWPHRTRGEGHFAAVLMKYGNQSGSKINVSLGKNAVGNLWAKDTLVKEDVLRDFNAFLENNLNIRMNSDLKKIGNNLYYMPFSIPNSGNRIKAAVHGWHLGRFTSGGFEPSQSLIMPLSKYDIKNVLDFSSKSPEIIKYLKGETLHADINGNLIKFDKTKGKYIGICVDGFTVGWAKYSVNILKNQYPKGWRLIPSKI